VAKPAGQDQLSGAMRNRDGNTQRKGSPMANAAHHLPYDPDDGNRSGLNDSHPSWTQLREIIARRLGLPPSRAANGRANVATVRARSIRQSPKDQLALPLFSDDGIASRSTMFETARALEIATDLGSPEPERLAALGLLASKLPWKLYGSRPGMLRRAAVERNAWRRNLDDIASARAIKSEIMRSAVALALAENDDKIRLPLDVAFSREDGLRLVQQFGRRAVRKVLEAVRPCDIRNWQVYWTWFIRRAIAFAETELRDLAHERSKRFRRFIEPLVEEGYDRRETPPSAGEDPEDPKSYFVERVLQSIDDERQLARDLRRLVPAEQALVRGLSEDVRLFAARALPLLTRNQRPLLMAALQTGDRATAFAAVGSEYSAGLKTLDRIRDRVRDAGVILGKTSYFGQAGGIIERRPRTRALRP